MLKGGEHRCAFFDNAVKEHSEKGQNQGLAALDEMEPEVIVAIRTTIPKTKAERKLEGPWLQAPPRATASSQLPFSHGLPLLGALLNNPFHLPQLYFVTDSALEAYSHSASLGKRNFLPLYLLSFSIKSCTSSQLIFSTGQLLPQAEKSDGLLPIIACHWPCVTSVVASHLKATCRNANKL